MNENVIDENFHTNRSRRQVYTCIHRGKEGRKDGERRVADRQKERQRQRRNAKETEVAREHGGRVGWIKRGLRQAACTHPTDTEPLPSRESSGLQSRWESHTNTLPVCRYTAPSASCRHCHICHMTCHDITHQHSLSFLHCSLRQLPSLPHEDRDTCLGT